MKDETYIALLDAHHTEFMSNKTTFESLNDNINFYESFIPDFFSKHGEASGIKQMYTDIKNQMDNEKSIPCINISESSKIYQEYMEGMINFIHDISDVNINESCKTELKKFEEKFNRAKGNDSIFIESLYNGRLNQINDMVLSEAVSNVEFLIDFIPTMKSLKNSCVSLNESFNNEQDENKKELINQSLDMLYESVDNYCYSTIKNIISTYESINSALYSVPKEIKSESEFRLF